MAPSRTRANPTGHEPRAVTKKDVPITAAESGADGEKPKRGRGRPPKNGVSKVVKIPSGRGRGRPPKDPSQKAALAAKAASEAKPAASTATRPRGRPRKSDTAATPKKAATPNKATSASKNTGSAKKRVGRPRKAEPVEVDEEEEEEEEEDISGAEEIKDDDSQKESPLKDEVLKIDDGEVADVEAGAALDGEDVHSPIEDDEE